jgi:long-chain acyl-CoA synthetase
MIDAGLQVVDFNRKDVILSVLPLSHIYAQVLNLLGPLLLGASVRFAEEATPQAVRRALEQGGVTAFGAVPQFFSLFRDRIQAEVESRGRAVRLLFRSLERFSRVVRRLTGWNPGRHLFPAVQQAFGGRLRLVVSAGSYLDPELARQFTDWGFTLLVAYGLTETGGAVTVTPTDDIDATTVGRPVPGVEVRIDRPDPEGIGEILTRGPGVMKGYWNRPEATAEVIDRDGWLHTGDLGRFDRSGNLVITGRAKELIVLPSGKNVYPEELDDHYGAHPRLSEVCVVGLPVPGGGERLHAVVVPDLDEFRRQGVTTVADHVRFDLENLGLELPAYQRVRAFSLQTDPLPRTPTRKVRRLEVRRRLLAGEIDESLGSVSRSFSFDGESEARLAAPGVAAVITAGHLEQRAEGRLHPDMTLEFDLQMDSLERAELMAQLGSTLGPAFDGESASQALTLGELGRVVGEALERGATATSGKAGWPELFEAPEFLAEAESLVPDRSPVRSSTTRASLVLGRMISRLLFRTRIIGAENLPLRGRPYIIAPNHVSFLDPLLLGVSFPWEVARDACYLGWSDYFRSGSGRRFARRYHIFPVDVGRNLVRALQLGAASLALGRILVVFPEGERSLDGRLQEFKRGTALLTRHTGAPVVPAAILGAFEAWPRGRSLPRPGQIQLVFGPPVDFRESFTDDAEADVERINGELRGKIADLIEDHGGPPPRPLSGGTAA